MRRVRVSRPARGRLRAHAFDLGLLLLGVILPLILLVELAEDVWRREGFAWDLDVMTFMHDRRGPVLDVPMVALSLVGGAAGLAVVVTALVVALARCGRRADAVFLVVAVAGAAAIEFAAKLAFARPRPDLWAHTYPAVGYSFPSGHAMSATALAVALAALASGTRWRWWVVGGGALFALGVGVSRVYLGVHYPSDVVAGWCAGLAWVSGLVLVRTMRAGPVGPVR
jgi:membrane-associated phospholipid phosphatase